MSRAEQRFEEQFLVGVALLCFSVGFVVGAIVLGTWCDQNHTESPSEAQEEPIEVNVAHSTRLAEIGWLYDAIEAGFCGNGGCPGQIQAATAPCRFEDVIYTRMDSGLWEMTAVCGPDGRWVRAWD